MHTPPMKLADVFPAELMTVKGECWFLIGPHGRRSAQHEALRREAYRIAGIPSGTWCELVCKNELCLHPLHYTPRMSVVGRMLYIQERTRQQGDCLIWTGRLCRGRPAVHVYREGASKHSTAIVPYYVWEQEYNRSVPNNYVLDTTCGEPLCVEATHLYERPRDKKGKA